MNFFRNIDFRDLILFMMVIVLLKWTIIDLIVSKMVEKESKKEKRYEYLVFTYLIRGENDFHEIINDISITYSCRYIGCTKVKVSGGSTYYLVFEREKKEEVKK